VSTTEEQLERKKIKITAVGDPPIANIPGVRNMMR
jgi:hypothetical protein